MKLEAFDDTDFISIRAYGPGFVETQHQRFTQSILLTPTEVRQWAPQTLAHLEPRHMAEILPLGPDVILLGTGRQQVFPPAALLSPCVKKGVAVEVMSTPAACRTYNLLAAEGRAVVCALLTLEEAPEDSSTGS